MPTAGLSIPGLGTARSLLRDLGRRVAGPSAPEDEVPASAPEFVDYSALMTPPPPFRCLSTTLYGFWARVDAAKVQALCEKVFAAPSRSAVTCRPIGPYVMITWGLIGYVSSLTAPYDQRGGTTEPQVAVWVPVVLRDPTSSRERFAMFIPYIWLDNPMSLADGREVFGYPKAWGWPDPQPNAQPPAWSLDVFGLDYGPGQQSARHPLLRVVQGDSLERAAAADLDSLAVLAREMAGRLLDPADPLGDVGLDVGVAEDVLGERFPGVFLKQFRDVGDGLAAALQQVVEVTYQVVRLKASAMPFEHELTVEHLDSHPVYDELGLESQTLGLAYHVEMDFDVGEGRVLWDAARG